MVLVGLLTDGRGFEVARVRWGLCACASLCGSDMLLGGLFQAWRSVCRGGASDLLTGERIACFSGVCPRVPLVTRCECRTKNEYCAGQTNGCQLEKLSVVRPCVLRLDGS